MKKTIKTYESNTGTVLVEKFTDNGHTDYRVSLKSASLYIPNSWFNYKTQAIEHAQFLAAKY